MESKRELNLEEMDKASGGNSVETAPDAYLAQLEEQYGALGMDDVHDKCTKEEWAKYQDLVYKKQLYSLYRSGGSVHRR